MADSYQTDGEVLQDFPSEAVQSMSNTTIPAAAALDNWGCEANTANTDGNNPTKMVRSVSTNNNGVIKVIPDYKALGQSPDFTAADFISPP